MRSAVLSLAVAAFTFALSFTGAMAGQQDFTIVNKTGYPIKNVYVSEANNDSWEEDILGRDILAEDDSVDVEFDTGDKTCTWDLKVTYDDDENAVWQGLDLCQISKVTLRWNQKTGVTSASVE